MKCSLKEILEEFLVYVSNERNFSNHTLKAYNRDLTKFINFIKDYYYDSFNELSMINRYHIRQFMANEFELGFSSKTVSRRLASIKSFFNYIVQIELLEDNPASHIKSPKVEKNIPEEMVADIYFELKSKENIQVQNRNFVLN